MLINELQIFIVCHGISQLTCPIASSSIVLYKLDGAYQKIVLHAASALIYKLLKYYNHIIAFHKSSNIYRIAREENLKQVPDTLAPIRIAPPSSKIVAIIQA